MKYDCSFSGLTIRSACFFLLFRETWMCFVSPLFDHFFVLKTPFSPSNSLEDCKLRPIHFSDVKSLADDLKLFSNPLLSILSRTDPAYVLIDSTISSVESIPFELVLEATADSPHATTVPIPVALFLGSAVGTYLEDCSSYLGITGGCYLILLFTITLFIKLQSFIQYGI